MNLRFNINQNLELVRRSPIGQLGVKVGKFLLPHEGNNYKPHTIRHKSLVFYSVLLILVKVILVSSLFLSFPDSAEFSTITINRIVELTNKQRQEQGLSVLQHSKILDTSALKKAQDMIKYNYFAHTSPNNIKPWKWFKDVGYNYTFAGENLAMNFIEAEDAISAWMDSPTHRDNILSKNYNEIGIAAVIGKIDGVETTIVVQHFGKTYTTVAGESFNPTSAPIETEQIAGPLNIIDQAAKQEVKLESKKQSGWIGKLVNYSEIFFLVILGFVILNLILSIIVRVEIQHKPIILHCLWVILLALTIIIFKLHFVEGLGRVVSVI